MADTVLTVSHGEVKVLKNRNEGVTNVSARFTYFTDSRLSMDEKDDFPLRCSWNREGAPVPERLARLRGLPVRFADCVEKDAMLEYVKGAVR